MTATKWSPMLEQYFGMKSRHPDAILLSRVGDFYEAYGDDAETISRALSIALTSKEAGGGERVAMAGVPHHALDGYLAKLIRQRRVVALAEQLEAPIPNKLVRRDVVRVLTPGTLIEEHILERGTHNFLAAVTSLEDVIALAHTDISTGHVAATAFAGEGALEDTLAEIARLDPAEVVADIAPNLRAALMSALEPAGTRVTSPPISVVDARVRDAIDGFSLDESVAVSRALDALAAFVRRAGIPQVAGEAFGTPRFYRQSTFLALDPNTRKHLELTRALGANPKATLLATVDATRTAMGSRTLGRWVLAPLIDRAAIVRRGDCVESLVRDAARRVALQEVLHRCFDLERIAQKVRFRRVLPRDLASLRRTLALLDPIGDALASETLPTALRALAARFGDFDDLRADLAAAIVDEPPATLADGGVIRPESVAELAECVGLRGDTRGRIASLEERERERSGIKSLKIKYASAFGYAIEIGKAHVANVPADYTRRQTLANGERFVTPELRELDVAIASAQARQLRLEHAAYEALVERIAGRVDALLETADALAELDAYASLAQIAAERGYVRPTFVDGSSIDIIDGRHPVVEALLGSSFVPNDVHLHGDQRFIVLTGPNMGGKSTFLRQTALLILLAQIGSFVPARSAQLGIVDRIFTRIGAGDDLASGQSTFYIEMAEAATILRRATSRSLLLIDEVGRGTGTTDGLAIAQAICEYLLEGDVLAPMVLFATHFHELVALADRWPLVANFHITAVESAARHGAPVFSHRVLPGSSSRSFGIEVARMAGLPPAVVARAREISDALQGRPTVESQVPLRGKLTRPAVVEQPLLWDV